MKLPSPGKIKPIIFFAFLLLFFSCKKFDITVEPEPKLEKFFKYSAQASPAIKNAISKLQELESLNPFVRRFTAKEGYPVWDKAKVSCIKKSLSRGDDNDIDTIVTVPVVPENASVVKDLLKIKLNGEIYFKLIKGENYAQYGFDKDIESFKLNADKLAVEIMSFEKELFGNEIYRIKDNRLFDYWNSEEYKPEEFFVSAKIYQCHVRIEFYDWVPGGELTGCPPGQDHCLDWVKVLVKFMEFDAYCDDGDSGGWGNDDEGWTNTPIPDEGGGGGSGNENETSIYTPSPCNTGWSPVKQGVSGEFYDVCDNSPVEIEKPNAEGFYQSRIDKLKNYLDLNSYGLLPCDELRKIERFGLMFQNVGSFKLPQALKNRIDSINNLFPFGNNSPLSMYQQTLENADGTVVNCDFYPIVINSLPNGFTAKSLLEYFRLNINLFSEPVCTFEPYKFNFFSNSFADTGRWYSPYESSAGAIVHLDIAGNDGSVILSRYRNQIGTTGNYENHNFIFSTLNSPLDFSHPVAGNREFGIYNTPDNPNQYFFYTMGVDRINNRYLDLFFSRTVFNGGDSLWTNAQREMIEFINQNGGSASLGNPLNIKARIDYSVIEMFLRKDIDFETLKLRLGC